MAGLLDYYKERPELWAENEYLLKKDPAYDLGLMDLTKMNFEEQDYERKGLNKFFEYTLPNFFGADASPFLPPRSAIASWSPRSGDITLGTGAFTEDDVPTSYGKDEYRPLYNLDKAQIMAHENRHALTNIYPELFDAQPSWSGLDPEHDSLFSFSGARPHQSPKWRQEAFNRYLDAEDYPAVPFKTRTAGTYPVGLSGINRIGGIKPQDVYFDKIWRDHWKPYAKRYDEIRKKIAARPRNVHGTPIVPMGGGRGRDAPSGGWSPSGADLSPGGGYGQSPTGSDIAGTPFSRGGILGAF